MILTCIGNGIIHSPTFAQTVKETEKIIEVRHNPNTDFIYVKVFGSQPTLDKFIITNIIGRVAKVKTYEGNELQLINELGNLPNGLYVLIAKDKNGKTIATIKFYL